MIKDLMTLPVNSFIRIEKGISIYDVEYILLYHYDFYFFNYDDPYKETKSKIGDVSNGEFHFHFFRKNNDNKKYMTRVIGEQYLNGNYFMNGIEHPCFTANQLLREYKINSIKTKINESTPVIING